MEVALGRLDLDEGKPDTALASFAAAKRRVARDPTGGIAAMAAYLALVGQRPAHEVNLPEDAPAVKRYETHVTPYRAGGDAEHMRRAAALLSRLTAHLSKDDVARLRRMSPLGELASSLCPACSRLASGAATCVSPRRHALGQPHRLAVDPGACRARTGPSARWGWPHARRITRQRERSLYSVQPSPSCRRAVVFPSRPISPGPPCGREEESI